MSAPQANTSRSQAALLASIGRLALTLLAPPGDLGALERLGD